MALGQNSVNLAAALAIGLIAGDRCLCRRRPSQPAFLLRAWTIPTTVDLLLMVTTGIIAAIAIWFLTQADRIAEANVIAPFEYSSIIWVVPLATSSGRGAGALHHRRRPPDRRRRHRRAEGGAAVT